MIAGINASEFMILLVLAMLVIGPSKLPEYAARLRDGVRQARDMATSAKTELRTQLGPEFDDVDWRQFDPRQYDPRRIVREALTDSPSPEPLGTGSTAMSAVGAVDVGGMRELRPDMARGYDPLRPTPWDVDAT